MKTREQFGSYLLLKKIAEDPFGESFRAGRIGRSGLDRVVLLRVFNGPGIDGQAFAQKLKTRRAVHEALRSPNIGEGVDLGDVHGIPYVAWDYVSGKNLATFFQQATRTGTPIPNDHALLITERIALALAVGYETRVDDKRLSHGCVVPELALLSNEGETRLLGFEAAPMLRQLAISGPAANHFAPYMSPEARAGQPVGKSDDVFSLGVILYELLTGEKLPVQANYDGVIAGAVYGLDGMPLAEEIKALLSRSLTTADQRIGDVVAWHKALSKAMFEGQYNPTTFNLAFFMHNLFRDEIERESHEIEAEKSIEVPRVPAAAATAAPAAPPSSDGAVREDTLAVRERYGMEETKKGGLSPAILGLGAVALLGLAGAGYMLFGKKETPVEPAPAVVETAPAPAVPTGPTPEELQAQIEALVAEQTKAVAEGFKQQQEAQIKALQDQLKQAQDAQKQAAERAAQQEADRIAAEKAAAEAAKKPEPAQVAETKPTEPETKAPAATTTVAETKPADPATKAPTASAAPAPAPVPPPTAAAPVTTSRPAATAAVRTGDLVTIGANVNAPKLIKRPVTRFPEMARRMNQRQATVRLRVLVDENGKVIDSQLAGAEVGYGFDREALRAAQSAEFEPAKTKDGVRVKVWFPLAIEFRG